MPSIQFEVRKKKPTSTAEFLDYAKEVEELFQLSNISIENNNDNVPRAFTNQKFSSIANTPSSINTNPINNSSAKFSSGYSRHFNNNYNTYNNQDYQYNQRTFTSLPNSFRSFQYPQKRSNNFNQRSQQNRHYSSSNTTNYKNTSNSQRHHYNSSNVFKQRSRIANTVLPLQSSILTDLEDEPSSPSTYIQCNQSEHDPSICSNF